MEFNLQLLAVTKVLARDWKFEIAIGTTPSWTEVKGVNSFTFGNSKNDADTTTFDTAGWNNHLVASRGRTLSVEGHFMEDVGTGTRDPGQQAVEDLGEKIGPASIGQFRLTSPGKKQWTMNGSVNVGDVGGGNDDPTSWGFELTVNGKPTVAQGV